MAQQSYVVFHLFIIIYLISISRCTSLPDESSLLPQDYIEEVAAYNLEAYPSYFSAIDDGSSDSIMLETRAPSSAKTVNVDEFGAKGDGKSDDTQAFKKAWSEACSSSTSALFVVSKNKNYLVKQITFQGPCKAPLTMKIYGTIEASADRSDYEEDETHWLLFENVNNLVIDGGGTFNGNGKIWWQNSCKIDKSRPCTNAPTALTFYKGQNLTVSNLKIENAQQIQVSFERCVNVEASNLQVTAPGNSPNTDGIHITGTKNMQLSTSSISTGDDCVSIETGTQNLQITDLTCGPGHGISIGSLGDGHSEAYVSDVTVNRAKLSGTTNGVRIKTYQGGSGSASNIKFQNINMQNVENPIIIDQYYCDKATPCKQQTSAVQVKNVVYQNIKGTSISSLAINFNCSKRYPCQGIILQDINLTTHDGKAAEANCNHVNLKEAGKVSPQCP